MQRNRGTWWTWLFGTAAKPRRLFTRKVEIAEPVLSLLRTDFTDEDRMEFAQLLLKLDANPIKHSDRLVVDPPIPGLRWASFADHKLILVFDPSRNRIRVLAIEL